MPWWHYGRKRYSYKKPWIISLYPTTAQFWNKLYSVLLPIPHNSSWIPTMALTQQLLQQYWCQARLLELYSLLYITHSARSLSLKRPIKGQNSGGSLTGKILQFIRDNSVLRRQWEHTPRIFKHKFCATIYTVVDEIRRKISLDQYEHLKYLNVFSFEQKICISTQRGSVVSTPAIEQFLA